eukprot:GFUD01131922.1.p1 GENE.GFUD01131922.1~~GFUD01131922.1.p1  ORF type:complete len:840 (+),score=155.46 GFUD01131922.1:47-2566(+)
MSKTRKVGDELKRSRNQIIKDVIKNNHDFFDHRIEDRLNSHQSFNSNGIDEAFFDIILEDENDDCKPLELLRTEIMNNGKIGFDTTCSDALKMLLGDLLLECVEKEKTPALKKVLNWIQFKLEPISKVKGLLREWSYEKSIGSDTYTPKWTGLTGNSQAMIRACEKDDFWMVSALMNFRIQLTDQIEDTFRIDDSEFKPCENDVREQFKNRFTARNFFTFPLSKRKYLEKANDILHHYNSFYAVSKPAYLIARAEKENKNKKFEMDVTPYDPISEAFHNLHIARIQSFRNVEYRNKFKTVKRESKEFIVKMLDRCENCSEARLFLLQDYKIDHYFTDAMIDEMPYPRIEVAVADKHEEFVAHDYCQQILREKWLQSDVTGEIMQWHSSKMYEKVFYFIDCVLLYPLHILMYIPTVFCGGYPKNKEGYQRQKTPEGDMEEETQFCCGLKLIRQSWLHLSFPINRFIANTISHLLFLIIIVLNSENPEDEDRKIDPDWYDFGIIVMAVGFLATECRDLWKRFKGKNFSFWNFFGISLYLILLGSKATIVIGYVLGCGELDIPVGRILQDCKLDTPDEHGRNSPVVVGYSFLGIGITMSFIKLIYFCQIDPTTGPIAISIKKIVKDIVLVTVTHLIFLFSFGLGIYYIMQATNDEKCEEKDRHMFRTPGDSFKALFWNLFDPGKIEQLGCKSIPEKAPRYLGMGLFFMFLLFNVVILMNALIAIMNSTLNAVNMDKIKQWKFARTGIWLQYISTNFILPCPFNLIEFLVLFVRFVYAKCTCQPKEQKNLRKEWNTARYMSLVEKLSERYRIHEEDSDKNDITREDIENTKQDIIHALRKSYG